MAKKKYYEDMTKNDYGMIKEDKSAPANLPQNVVMKDWSHDTYFNHSDLNDKASGIDRQIDADVGGANKHRSKSKY